MKVQVYRDGPPRVFATGDQYMICELNTDKSRGGAEEAMDKLGFRRAQPWQRTSWGFEARFRRQPLAQDTER